MRSPFLVLRLRFPIIWRLSLLLACLSLGTLEAHAQADGKRYGLLVGIGEYKQQQWSSLVNPVHDVRTLEAELRHRYKFLPEVLENPSREEIVSKLRRYYRLEFGPNDQLVIVFAGHGTYDDVSGIGYLVASDSSNRQQDPNFVTSLNYPWLLALIDHIDCPNILLVVDACYSGALQKQPASGSSSGSNRVRQFITSGGVEYVPDGDPNRHTPFMRQLLAGLRAPSRGDSLSLDSLRRRFMSQVEPRPRWGSFGSHHSGGQFTLVMRGSAPPYDPIPLPSRPQRAASSATRQTAPPPPSSSLLRSQGMQVSDSQLERAFRRLVIHDVTRNPEGDFPNEFRTQQRQGLEVVVDLASGLTWQWRGSEHRLTVPEAKEYILRLNRQGHAAYSDWRLPTVEELASLIEPSRQNDGLFIDPRFHSSQDTGWTSDQDRDGRYHYFVSFNAGRATLGFGNRRAFVRAVRSN